MDNTLSWLFGDPVPAWKQAYLAYLRGEYTPSEARPVIRIPGDRKWYAPWSRYPDTVDLGMSEAMAFRAQQAQDTAMIHAIEASR